MEKDIIYQNDSLDLIEAIKVNESLKQELKDLKNHIEDLNGLIGKLSKENKEIKINSYENIVFFMKVSKCKYPPYMVRDFIEGVCQIDLSSRDITSIAEKNNLFKNDDFVIRVPRKRKSEDKFASTVIFSQLGIVKIIKIVEEIKKNNFPLLNEYYETGHTETDGLLRTSENRERVKKSLEEYKSGEFIKKSAKELGLI